MLNPFLSVCLWWCGNQLLVYRVQSGVKNCPLLSALLGKGRVCRQFLAQVKSMAALASRDRNVSGNLLTRLVHWPRFYVLFTLTAARAQLNSTLWKGIYWVLIDFLLCWTRSGVFKLIFRCSKNRSNCCLIQLVKKQTTKWGFLKGETKEFLYFLQQLIN